MFAFISSITLVGATLPTYFDWRDNDGDWMTGVKHQRFCGSCWAFASLAVVEAQYNIENNDTNFDLNLSEQQLISNCSGAGDCSGGWHSTALSYVQNEGVVSESCFPYVDSFCTDACGCNNGCSNAVCSDNLCQQSNDVYTIEDYDLLPANDSIIKEYLYEVGPVVAAMRFEDSFWDGDHIRRCNVSTPVDHAVVIVGYNETGNYWIIRNSWGNNWEGDGHFNLRVGECSIEDHVYGVNVSSEIQDPSLSSESITISNIGNSQLEITSITDDKDWIVNINPTSFTVLPNETRDVSVTVNSTNMSSGQYFGILTIISNDPDENPEIVPVTMNIYCIDNDDDGYDAYNETWCPSGTDCNDFNDNINIDEVEICDDGIDNNCNDLVDCNETSCLSHPNCGGQPQANGASCSLDMECQSGYCDNDGLGDIDDEWCFTPYNTYFDEIDNTSCEYSTGYGSFEADEKQPNSNLTICSIAGESYFADQVSLTCEVVDRDNICRSSSYSIDCLADPQCNGVEAGTNNCDLSCDYNEPNDPPSTPTIIHPNGGEQFNVGDIVIINWSQSNDPDGSYVSYLLEYSDDSGVSWNSIISDYGYEDEFDDGETEKRLTYEGNDDQTVYIRIPKNAEVLNAEIDLTGES